MFLCDLCGEFLQAPRKTVVQNEKFFALDRCQWKRLGVPVLAAKQTRLTFDAYTLLRVGIVKIE